MKKERIPLNTILRMQKMIKRKLESLFKLCHHIFFPATAHFHFTAIF